MSNAVHLAPHRAVCPRPHSTVSPLFSRAWDEPRFDRRRRDRVSGGDVGALLLGRLCHRVHPAHLQVFMSVLPERTQTPQAIRPHRTRSDHCDSQPKRGPLHSDCGQNLASVIFVRHC